MFKTLFVHIARIGLKLISCKCKRIRSEQLYEKHCFKPINWDHVPPNTTKIVAFGHLQFATCTDTVHMANCSPRVRLVLDLKVTNWPNWRVYTNTRDRLDTCIPILVATWPRVLLYTCLTVRHVYFITRVYFVFF